MSSLDICSTMSIFCGDALEAYATWLAPTCIISDGPYGLVKYPGEPVGCESLPDWYRPHIVEWAKYAVPNTTLWFWNSEIGWATVHPVLESNGWQYEECCVWNKGIAHVAGNCNSKTIRGIPVVTEIAVRYTRKPVVKDRYGNAIPMKEWLRAEWKRSGLPLCRANEACGVRDAATRKYLTQSGVWYFPPAESVVKMAKYCTQNGVRTDRPYFSLDGKTGLTVNVWNGMRAKWRHTHGLTNVWSEPPVHGKERLRGEERASSYLHANQKPLSLMRRQILSCTDEGDVVWEPFGGLCSATVASLLLGRRAFSAENNPLYHKIATKRLKETLTVQYVSQSLRKYIFM